MRKTLFIFLISFSIVVPRNTYALDAKGKAFLVICTYGTVGGALLGFASMAFGTNSRAIAQGASLGLYAGIAFGSYVIASHRPGDDDEAVAPAYQQQAPPPPGFGSPADGAFGQPNGGGFGDPMGQPPAGGGGGFGAPVPEDNGGGGGFFGQRVQEINEDLFYNYKLKNKKSRGLTLPIYVPLIDLKF